MADVAFDRWVADLEARQLSDLQFREVSRALRALSATYVERREKLRDGAALSGAGKRAAFAMFYGPLHFLLVREIVRALELAAPGPAAIVDLGCGTGVAGAAWASEQPQRAVVHGIDVNPWALSEAERTWRAFEISGRGRRGDLAAMPWPKERAAVIAAFAVNELSDASRAALLERLLAGRATEAAAHARTAGGHQAPVLVVEPIARAAAPWWRAWRAAFERAGGRADEWRFRVALPPLVTKLDRAAALDHRELTARSLLLK
jgi:SAM-dependent methyltransferase